MASIRSFDRILKIEKTEKKNPQFTQTRAHHSRTLNKRTCIFVVVALKSLSLTLSRLACIIKIIYRKEFIKLKSTNYNAFNCPPHFVSCVVCVFVRCGCSLAAPHHHIPLINARVVNITQLTAYFSATPIITSCCFIRCYNIMLLSSSSSRPSLRPAIPDQQKIHCAGPPPPYDCVN